MQNTSNGTVTKSRRPRQVAPVTAVAVAVRPETFNMPGVGAYFGVHPQTARDWVRRGILPLPVIKVGRTVRWSRAQLEQFTATGVQA